MEPDGVSFYTVLVIFDTLSNLFQRLSSVTPYVLLAELALIGLMVNWCAGVLHGTRGTRLLRGLLVVLVVATLVIRVLAEQLQWTRLALLYQYFIIGMAFIALVAFQPELRRALIRAGDVRFLRRRLPLERLIPALVESIGYLSRNRYGALIAIQRDVGLANWAENGTQINAEISANLLKTIFFPNSALHDLGVIIRGNRIQAAGCQFPVAESGEVDSSLGSRHRAAVGLSAESDALVLVVSEETGTISLADGGKLTRFLALDDLEEELEARLAGGYLAPRRRRRVRTMSDSWRIIRRLLVVVPLTLVIWFLADQASLIADTVEIELNITPGPSLHVDTLDPPRFRVAVRGPRRDIDALRAATADHPLRLDWTLPASYARPGPPQVLGEEQLLGIIGKLPELQRRDVLVENVTPARFRFGVHEVISLKVPVRIDAGALRVTATRIVPEQVRVWLRRDDLDGLAGEQRFVEAVLGDRLTGVGLGRDLSFTDVVIEPRMGDTSLLRVEPRVVNVDVHVVAEMASKRLEGIRVRVSASPQLWQRYQLDPYDINEWLIEIEVEGDRSLLDGLGPQDVRAFVPLSSDEVAAGDDYRLATVVVELPAGVSLVGAPREVRYRLRARQGGTP